MKIFASFIFTISLNLFSQEIFNLEPRYQFESTVPNQVYDFGRNIKKTVKYFSEVEANFYKVQFTNGRIMQNGENYFTDMQRSRPHTIFVLDLEDNLYICDCNSVNEIHHSSFKQGMPVKAAGEMYIHDGIILKLNNFSGHYRPNEKSLIYLLDTISEKGYQWESLAETTQLRVTAKPPTNLASKTISNPCSLNFLF